MNNFQQTARVGLFFLLGLALTWVTFETLRGGKIFKDQGYNIIAGFETLKELKDGDEVRMAGVKIGDLACIVPHQVNIRIIESAMEELQFPMEKVFINLTRYGSQRLAAPGASSILPSAAKRRLPPRAG